MRVGPGVSTRDKFISLPATGGLAKWKAYVFGPIIALVALPFVTVGLLLTGVVAAVAGKGACSRLAERERKTGKDMASRIGGTDLMKVSASSLGTDKNAVINKLVEHSKENGSNLDFHQLQQLVEVGEGVVNYLMKGDEGFVPGTTQTGAPREDARAAYMDDPAAKPYLAKAVAWYMMAKAAQKDVINEAAKSRTGVDHLPNVTRENVMQMPDPEGRLYAFLKSVPTAAPRMSTHWLKQSATKVLHTVFGFIPVAKPEQWGIDSFAHELPGKGGAMVFDQLVPVKEGGPSRLAVKFEDCGCPSFSLPKDAYPGTTRFEWFAAASRINAGHALSFAATRGDHASKNAKEVGRTEHTGKKIFKQELGKELNEIHDLAQRIGFRYVARIGSGGPAVGGKTLTQWQEYLPELGNLVARRRANNVDAEGRYLVFESSPDALLEADAYDRLPKLCEEAIEKLANFAQRVEGASGSIDGLSPMGAEVLIDIVPKA